MTVALYNLDDLDGKGTMRRTGKFAPARFRKTWREGTRFQAPRMAGHAHWHTVNEAEDCNLRS